MTLEIPRQVLENIQVSNLMKIHPVEAKLFHADGRTDRYTTKLIVAFRSFAKAPKMTDT
jgi:hypothetical protein